MANDVPALAWSEEARTLTGTSAAVPGDPYELRVHVPESFSPESHDVPGEVDVELKQDVPILRMRWTPRQRTCRWSLRFTSTDG